MRYREIEIIRPELIKAAINPTKIQQGLKIYHFGDSHIQGDRISGEIRDGLQNIGGNGGSGLIFPYSLCRSVGPQGTISKILGNYTWSNILKNPNHLRIGALGYEITLAPGANFSIEFTDQFRGKTSAVFSILIAGTADSIPISLSVPGKLKESKPLIDGVVQYTFEAPEIPKKIAFSVNQECALWGIRFESDSGIIYQQCGVVGAQFTHLLSYQKDILGLLTQEKPDMILFSYGTNESYSTLDSIAYEKQYVQFLKDIQRNLPETSILITNAPDTRSGGKVPNSELLVNRTLKRIADASAVSYYDVNLAMGAWGSHYIWNDNGLFLKDQLHFNKKGGVLLGQLIERAILKAGGFDASIIDPLEKRIDASFPLPIKKTVTPEKPILEESNRYYVVQSGDTITSIAKKVGKSVAELCSSNQISNPNQIKVGQKIRY